MVEKCSHADLIAEVRALEANLAAFEKLMDERDKRYEQRARGQDDAVVAALAAAKEATVVAKTEVDSHLKSLNEIRTMSLDQAKTFAVGRVVDLQIEGLKTELKGLRETTISQLARGVGMKEMVGYLFGAAGLLAVIFDMYFRR